MSIQNVNATVQTSPIVSIEITYKTNNKSYMRLL